MRILILLAICVAAISALPSNPQRIVGGQLTTIDKYPEMVAMLYSTNLQTYTQSCAGSILNNRFILTAAHCLNGRNVIGRWRIRAGSTFANSGGTVYNLDTHILHRDFVPQTFNNDIAIVRTVNPIVYNDQVKAAFIAGSTYNLGDNEEVIAIGWGDTEYLGWPSEQLRDVQVWTVSHAECSRRYGSQFIGITPNMLCSGWLGVGGRDQCHGDSGGPLFHRGTVVGICSFGLYCANHFLPGVNVRVTRYTDWITENAVLRN